MKIELEKVFKEITHKPSGEQYRYSSRYNIAAVNANIRKAFCDIRDYSTTEELIPEKSNLLNISNFSPDIYTDTPERYYPSSENVEKIVKADSGKLKLEPKMAETIEFLEQNGQVATAMSLRNQYQADPNRDKSYHYLPYRTDSDFEIKFLGEVLTLTDISKCNLEVYYNGDRAMTEFKIKCFKKVGSKWNYVGIYTPDFLIIQRKDGKIYKTVIVETKGEIYSHDPTFDDKRKFMESDFARLNNKKFGYERFDYLYLEDTLSESKRLSKTHEKLKEFFGGEN